MILIKKIIDGKEVYEPINKEEAMKLENKDVLFFTSDDEKEDFFEEIEDLEDKIEDLEDELEDIADEIEDEMNEDNDQERIKRLKEKYKKIEKKIAEYTEPLGRYFDKTFQEFETSIKDIGKSVANFTKNAFKDNSKGNRLIKVLPFLDQEDVHALVEDLLNDAESLKDIDIIAFLPFLSTKDCDSLFIRAIEEGNKKYFDVIMSNLYLDTMPFLTGRRAD